MENLSFIWYKERLHMLLNYAHGEEAKSLKMYIPCKQVWCVLETFELRFFSNFANETIFLFVIHVVQFEAFGLVKASNDEAKRNIGKNSCRQISESHRFLHAKFNNYCLNLMTAKKAIITSN